VRRLVDLAVRDGPEDQAVVGLGSARIPPLAFVLGAIVSIQFGAALAATLFDELDASAVSLMRLGFAAIVLLAVWRPRPRAHARGDLALAAGFGVCLGLMNFTFYEAIERIDLGIAVTLEFLGPLGVAVYGSRSRTDVLWVVLAAAGVLMLADPGGADAPDTLGVAFALMAAAFWAAYIVLAARAGQRFTGGTGLSLAMVVAVLVPLGPGLASGPGELLGAEVLLIGFGVALMSSVIPYSLETEALRRMPKNVFGVLMSLEPGVAALAGFLILGQALGARELLAIGLVVAASAGATRYAPSPPEPG
jgi:inner membrane transporter RhtA